MSRTPFVFLYLQCKNKLLVQVTDRGTHRSYPPYTAGLHSCFYSCNSKQATPVKVPDRGTNRSHPPYWRTTFIPSILPCHCIINCAIKLLSIHCEVGHSTLASYFLEVYNPELLTLKVSLLHLLQPRSTFQISHPAFKSQHSSTLQTTDTTTFPVNSPYTTLFIPYTMSANNTMSAAGAGAAKGTSLAYHLAPVPVPAAVPASLDAATGQVEHDDFIVVPYTGPAQAVSHICSCPVLVSCLETLLILPSTRPTTTPRLRATSTPWPSIAFTARAGEFHISYLPHPSDISHPIYNPWSFSILGRAARPVTARA